MNLEQLEAAKQHCAALIPELESSASEVESATTCILFCLQEGEAAQMDNLGHLFNGLLDRHLTIAKGAALRIRETAIPFGRSPEILKSISEWQHIQNDLTRTNMKVLETCTQLQSACGHHGDNSLAQEINMTLVNQIVRIWS